MRDFPLNDGDDIEGLNPSKPAHLIVIGGLR